MNANQEQSIELLIVGAVVFLVIAQVLRIARSKQPEDPKPNNRVTLTALSAMSSIAGAIMALTALSATISESQQKWFFYCSFQCCPYLALHQTKQHV